MHGLNTLEYQPQKVAAMEGNWETQGNVPLLLFALPDEEARQNRFEIGIPNGASLILKHHADGVVPGLNDFVAEDGTILHPPVAPVFWSFRIMVGTGMAMLALSWAGVMIMAFRKITVNGVRRRAGIDGLPMPLLYALVPMAFSGWVATLAGWYTTEIGRQPWLVQGVLSTEQAVAAVPAPFVGLSLAAYLAIYAALLVAYVSALFYLVRKAATGEGVTPAAPLAAQAPLPAE
jgi:cytochrome d ubiquinol oxidase subunit I